MILLVRQSGSVAQTSFSSWPASRAFIEDIKTKKDSKIPIEERRTGKDFLRIAAMKSLVAKVSTL